MKTTYQVFTTIKGVEDGGVVYKQLKRAEDSAKRSAINLLATQVRILGFDEFGERTGYQQVIKRPIDVASQKAMGVLNDFFAREFQKK